MVAVTMLSGPKTGHVLEFSEWLSPQDLLCGIAQYKWQWSTDFSEATAHERELWEKQDIAMRCVRALSQGAEVRFLDKTYHTGSLEGAFAIAAEIEDDLVAFGGEVFIRSDDDQALVIGTRQD